MILFLAALFALAAAAAIAVAIQYDSGYVLLAYGHTTVEMTLWVALALLAGTALPAAGQDAIRCTLLVDAATGKVLVREGQCEQRVTPASTFKVALSLMQVNSISSSKLTFQPKTVK